MDTRTVNILQQAEIVKSRERMTSDQQLDPSVHVSGSIADDTLMGVPIATPQICGHFKPADSHIKLWIADGFREWCPHCNNLTSGENIIRCGAQLSGTQKHTMSSQLINLDKMLDQNEPLSMWNKSKRVAAADAQNVQRDIVNTRQQQVGNTAAIDRDLFKRHEANVKYDLETMKRHPFLKKYSFMVAGLDGDIGDESDADPEIELDDVDNVPPPLEYVKTQRNDNNAQAQQKVATVVQTSPPTQLLLDYAVELGIDRPHDVPHIDGGINARSFPSQQPPSVDTKMKSNPQNAINRPMKSPSNVTTTTPHLHAPPPPPPPSQTTTTAQKKTTILPFSASKEHH